MADGELRFDTRLNIADAEKDLAKLKKKIKDAENTLSEKGAAQSALKTELDEAKQAGLETEKAIDRINKALAETEKILDYNQWDISTSMDPQKYLDALDDQKKLKESLSEQEKVLEQQDKEIERLAGKYEKVTDEIITGKEALSEMKEEAGRQQQIIDETARKEAEAAKSAEEAAERSARAAARMELLHDVLKRVGDVSAGATKGIKDLASRGLKKLVVLIPKAAKGMLGLSKNTGKVNSGFKTLLRYGLGIRSVFVLFNKMRSALVEGFKNLAQASPDVNQAISSVLSALTQLKNAFATAFAPLLTVVAPILAQFINMLSAAADAVARFAAILAGKSTYKKAIAVQEDYAASLDKTGQAAEEAAGSLAAFDEITQIQTENSKAAGGNTASSMFEDAAVGEMPDAKSWFDRLKEAFEKGDWKGIGKIIAQGLNKALTNAYKLIKTKIRPFVEKIAKAFAEFLNGLTEEFGWEQLGSTIAEILNTAFSAAYNFLTTYNFVELGKGIARAINQIMEDTDFKLIGETIGAKLRAAIELAFGFVKEFDFKKAGQDIADAINGFFEEMGRVKEDTGLTGWQELGQTLALTVNGIIDALTAALSGVNWADVAHGVGEAVSSFLDTSDLDVKIVLGALIIGGISKVIFGGGAGAVTTAITDALAALFGVSSAAVAGYAGAAAAVVGLNLGLIIEGVTAQLANGITEEKFRQILFGSGALGSFLSGGTWSGNRVGTTIGWIIEFMVATKIVDDETNGGLTKAIKEYLESHNVEQIKEDFIKLGKNLVEGLKLGMSDEMREAFEWVETHIFDPIITAFKHLFGIASPSKVMKEQGGYISEGLLEGIKSGIQPIIDKFNGLKTSVTQILQAVLTFINGTFKPGWQKAWNGLKDTFKGVWNGIVSMLESAVNLIINGINAMVRQLNKVSFKLPNWVPTIGGKSFGFNVPTISRVSIPRLAAGAVIPPNREFLAVLGDQRRGTNVEAPLDTIKQALIEAMRESGGGGGASSVTVVVDLDGREIARNTIHNINAMTAEAGRSLLRV